MQRQVMNLEWIDPRVMPARVFDLIFGWDVDEYVLEERERVQVDTPGATGVWTGNRTEVFRHPDLTTAIKRSKEYALQLDAAGCVFIDPDNKLVNMKKP